jgi:hypothetical protein
MHDTEAKPEAAIEPRREAQWADLCNDPDALEVLVEEASMSGNLEAPIAFACEEAMANDPPPDAARHAGARAAIEAYAAWKQAAGRDVPINVLHPDADPGPEPEILPLSMLGKWVAWSSDGLRIVASAETIEEAERLAAEAGEPEPIMHRPMAMRRL